MILNKYMEENIVFRKASDRIESIKKKISFKCLFFILLTFLLANQTFITQMSPFIYVLFGVASLFDVPLILILLSALGSTWIGGSSNLEIAEILSFFVLFTLVTTLLNIEGVSKKHAVYMKFILSFSVIQLIFAFVSGEMIPTFFANLGNILIVSILYYIFSSGIYVMVNRSNTLIFSKEESIAMVVVCAMAMTVFSEVHFYSLSLSNILIMVCILLYGWKAGPVCACAAGMITGLLATCVYHTGLDFVIVLGIGGLLAGVFRKFGKISIVIAFILGNIYVSYYTNHLSDIVVRVAEMLIASISLLLIPKRVEGKLDPFFHQGKTLEKPYENMLDTAATLKNKIGAISDVFDTLSDIELEETPEDKIETKEAIEKYMISYMEENCISCQKKSNCLNQEQIHFMANTIFSKLENKEELTKDDLAINCDTSEKIIQDLQEIYTNIKMMRILKQKEKESSDKLSKQYKEIAKLLNNISESMEKDKAKQDKLQQVLRNELKMCGFVIYEDEFKRENDDMEYTFVTDILTNIDKQKKQIISVTSSILEKSVNIKLILNSSKKEKSKIKIVTIPNFEIKTAIVSEKKEGNEVSGDSYLCMELSDLKHVSIISDGAGSGKAAAKGSQTVINLLEKLLESGFNEENAVKIMNSFLKLKGNDTTFSTLDTFIFDLKNAKAQFIKLGAAPTYIRKEDKVTTIHNINIPLGLISESDYLPIVSDLNDSSIVVQITDGVIDESYDCNQNYLTKYLQTVDITKSTKLIADEIHKLILKEKDHHIKDDFTVIVSKVCKNH